MARAFRHALAASEALLTPSNRRIEGGILRLAAGLALVALLFHWHLIDLAALRTLLARPQALALAAAASLAAIPLEALRWQVLLRAQGLVLPLWTTVRVLAMSLFFSNFLPGSAGGDVMRAVFIYGAAKGRRAPAMLSILVDRFIGFVAFLTIGLVAVAVRPGALQGTIAFAIVAVSAAVAAGLAIFGLFGSSLAAALRRFFDRHSPRLAQVIVETEAAFRQYAVAWRSAALAFALSLPIVLLWVVPVMAIGKAMQLSGVTAFDYGTAGLYALLANSLPLTPGGLGVGEAAFASGVAMLAPQAGPAAYGTIFLVYRGVLALATLPGFIVYLVGLPSDRPR